MTTHEITQHDCNKAVREQLITQREKVRKWYAEENPDDIGGPFLDAAFAVVVRHYELLTNNEPVTLTAKDLGINK